MMEICVVGAGPAGIMAALKAGQAGGTVRLFDSNNQIGRKLLVTGSGRCNITHMQAGPDRYHCGNATWLRPLFDLLPPPLLRSELRKLGILTYATPDGWCYPVSESAANVVAALQHALVAANVKLHLNTLISSIRVEKERFELVDAKDRKIHCERLILASGGKAYPALGSTGILFSELQRIGHSIHPILPALAPLKANIAAFHPLQGTRLDVLARLWKKNQLLGESTGNVIVTAWGFNGPAVMNLSHLVSLHDGEDLQLELDLIPHHKNDLRELISNPENTSTPMEILLGAVLPHKIPQVILQISKLPLKSTCAQLDQKAKQRLWEQLTSVRFSVRGTRGFEFCQSKIGGVPLEEIQPSSFQSRIIPHLYLAGEVLDVVGPCGGYNLHFAFSSGFAAGIASSSEMTSH
jgi:predicted Rossmann fold flavoprotein